MHWGTYAQWGIVESWSLCPEDEGWTVRRGPYSADYQTYKAQYEALPRVFNPVQFNPEAWADAAKYAGMKYVVFTTKHHDGFCMFDTKQTDYKITNPDYPFASNPRSNIAKFLRITIVSARGITAMDGFTSDPFVVVTFGDTATRSHTQ